MIKVKAESNGYANYEELGGDKGKMYDGVIIGTLNWNCPYCGKRETFGNHTMQNAFQKECECGKTYIVEYWHEKSSRN